MKSIKELRLICQPNSKLQKDPFLGKILYRKISIYFTYIAIHLGFSADFISSLRIIASIIGILLIGVSRNISFAFLGIIFLQFDLILDAVDGEVARYNQNKCNSEKRNLKGIFVDSMGHDVVLPLMIFFFGLGTSKQYFPKYMLPILLIAFLGALGILGLPNKTLCELVYNELRKRNHSERVIFLNDFFFSDQKRSEVKSNPILIELLVFPGLPVNISLSISLELILIILGLFNIARLIRIIIFLVLSISYILNLFRTFNRNYKHL